MSYQNWVKCPAVKTVTLNQLKVGDIFRRVDNLDISGAWLTVCGLSNKGHIKVTQVRPSEWNSVISLKQRFGIRYVRIQDDPRIPFE